MVETIKWVFSGVGVLLIAGAVRLYQQQRQKRGMSAGAPLLAATSNATSGTEQLMPPQVLAKKRRTQPRLSTWLNETRRIRIGDFCDIFAPGESMRIELMDIRTAAVPDKYGGYPEPRLCADIAVSIGGAVVCGGPSTADREVNRALVPRAESYDEPAASLYDFHASENHFSSIRFAVKHINQHDRTVDVSIVAVRVRG